MDTLLDAFNQLQLLLFESVVQPIVFAAGGASILEVAYRGTGWLLVGLIQLLIMLALIGPLERWRPVQVIRDRMSVRTDVLYTLIHRLGLFRVAVFFAVDPLWDQLWGWLAVNGHSGWRLDSLIEARWPGWNDLPLANFALYLLIFDFVDYVYHRASHHFDAWWGLHALHHSQRELTMWADNRNHLLDDLLRDIVLVQLGHLIGVPPGQFVALVAVTQLVQSLSHANVRLDFGRVGERLLVGPRYHRYHHSIGEGHESAGVGTLGGHNFAVLFPVWDVLFGTARFGAPIVASGIRDQLPEAGGRDYGQGFWAQQWLGLCRLVGRG
ncbi:MAG: sterol desaturase family protein [Leptothrix sp. (in: b-proteobacteria)]